MPNEITLPIVHLNGTSARDLTEGYLECARAISEALGAIRKLEFNWRDYYPKPGSWELARSEMVCRIESLEDMKGEFETIAMHCSNFIKP